MKQYIVERLELVNYLRMAPAIQRLVYTPDDEYSLQIVLGTNGCGKSSMQYELWPLPPSENDFGIGGKKDQIIRYDGRTYQLISHFDGNKPRHQFIVDGEDLNDGGKIEMFRSLALEHFGVTNEIRALALEKEVLTNMGPSRRRYWMVKLSDSDFTYAIERYNKLCGHHRDAQGASKRLKKRLVEETSKLVDADVVINMRESANEVRKIISKLYGMRDPKSEASMQLRNELVSKEEYGNKLLSEIDRINIESLESCKYSSRDEMEQAKRTIDEQTHATQQLIQHHYSEHSRIKKKYDLLIQSGTETIAELEEKIKTGLLEVQTESQFIIFSKIVPTQDPEQMLNAFRALYTDLYDALLRLPVNDGYYSSAKAAKAESETQILISWINPLKARISRLNEDMMHKRDHLHSDQLVCPKCTHAWSALASKDDMAKFESLIAGLTDELLGYEEKLEVHKSYLSEMSEYSIAYRSVMMLIRSAPVLAPYFAEITQNNRLLQHPGAVAAEFHIVESDLTHWMSIRAAEKVVAKYSEQIEIKRNLSADTLENIESEMEHISASMNELNVKLIALSGESLTIQSLLQRHNHVVSVSEKLTTHAKDMRTGVKHYIYSRYQELLWQTILEMQMVLARKEDALNQATSQQAVVDDIKHQIAEAEMNERIAKAAHQALSPTTGAIAEGLNLSMNNFIGRINRIISAIWVQPLRLCPFAMVDDQVEMDYKFPFTKADGVKPTKDVDEGSESMIAMFNFAFRMAAMHKLGLGHMPLFLDEFESAFDDVHRERATYFVKKLLDEKVFGQIFMVSHYESNHGALSSLAQTCVLDRDNLMLPTNVEYNSHVSIN